MENIELTNISEKNLKEYFYEKIELFYTAYIKYFQITLAFFSEAPVHDLRVAIRRFVALLELLGEIANIPYCGQTIKALKKNLTIFAQLRDVQVQILSVYSLTGEYPALDFYFKYLQAAEAKIINTIKEKLKNKKPDGIQGLVFFLKLEMKKNFPANSLIINNIINHVNQVFAELTGSFGLVSTADPAAIHKFRLKFKPFRYKMEIIQPIFKFDQNHLKEMKSYQTLLGSIQDNNVLLKYFGEFVSSGQFQSEELFSAASEYFISCKTKLISEFMKESDKIYEFWNKIEKN